MGTLYIVSTPIGNLGDITIRAIKTLFSVDYIACEDTRRTGRLLAQLKKLHPEFVKSDKVKSKHNFVSYHEHNESKKTAILIKNLRKGKSVALVSDAGTPLLSDPGYRLVRECVKNNIEVASIPGASSILTALVPSGLPPYPFLFVGYPPKKSNKRKLFFIELSKLIHHEGGLLFIPTVIIFVSPHKVISFLTDFIRVFGDQHIVVARELTKLHEEFIRDKASRILSTFKESKPKGELTMLFNLRY